MAPRTFSWARSTTRRGSWDEARKYFEKAHEVSGRRVFQGEDPKYFKFLKEKRK